MKRYY
ncbi:hypothetical protein BDFB_013975 [Asbolus verrucosus]